MWVFRFVRARTSRFPGLPTASSCKQYCRGVCTLGLPQLVACALLGYIRSILREHFSSAVSKF